ncbi:dual 3 -5 -cyclic-AMP and -GMP phosphodiesterase 11-like isoform X4, partial [Brachionus plicatilis]
MPFISIAIRNSNLYSQSQKEAQTNKVLLELATIVFDESASTVDHLVSRILFNSIFLLECENCQVILFNTNVNNNLNTGVVFPRRPSFHDVNKYFDRVYELNYNDLKTNESFSPEILVKSRVPNFTVDSPELSVINTVSHSGEILNVQNAKEDARFSHFGEVTNTNSFLCIPVTNCSDQVVALILACNKIKSSTLNYFSRSDINVAEAFALFCGIGIQNIMMYEKVVRAMNMQQVALDVLSYHVSSNQDEVDRLIEEEIPEAHELGLYSFFFDENTLDDMGTLKACISMFGELELVEKFNIPYDVLCRFFLTVKKNYRPVAYHNWRHGFNVMSAMFTILTTGQFKNTFNDLEILSLLIACICHDLDHRGTTNNFQIKIQSPLAKLYTTSTMEHHHFNQCIVILHNNVNNILTNLTPLQHSTAIDLIEKAILATDLALHFKHIDKFIEKSNSPSRAVFEATSEKELLLNILMTACDLSGGAKPWKCHYRLSQLVSSEFFSEGDLEKEKFKREPIDSMNRSKSDKLPQMQIQFLQSVCMPMYHGLSLCNPLMKPMLDG